MTDNPRPETPRPTYQSPTHQNTTHQSPTHESPTHLNTPPFAGPSFSSPYGPDGRLRGYTAADFPAPAGVPPLGAAGTSTQPTGTPAGATALLTPTTAPRTQRRGGTVIAAAALSAILGAGAGIGAYALSGQAAETASSPIKVTTVPAAQAPVLDGTISAAAAKISPSVVTIAVQAGQSGGLGTGVVLDTDGHILTNNHVVEAAADGQGKITVTFDDGTTAEATIVGRTATTDLAVIKVDGVSNLTPATFAESQALVVGQSVVAMGAPLGLSESVTSGIVSSTARPVRSGDDGNAVYLAVQTDAAINPGNSGGPLVDLNGAVIGINSSIASMSSGESGGQSGSIGIGFAIPSDVATRVAANLIADGSSPDSALGVTLTGSDSEYSAATGVALQSVVDGKAAAEAGLQAGDVVTKVDDFRTTTPDGLIAAVRFYAPGTKVTVTYLRDGAEQTAEVTLGTS